MKNFILIIIALFTACIIISCTSNYRPIALDEDHTYVILAGIRDYENSDIREVQYAEADIELMEETLLETGIPDENIVVLFNENATRINIANAIQEAIDKAGIYPNSTIIFYFAGHGTLRIDENNYLDNAFLLTWEADLDLLDHTSYPLELLHADLNRAPDKLVSIVDACFTNNVTGSNISLERGIVVSPQTQEGINNINTGLIKNNHAYLFATNINGTAFEIEELGHGLFTYWICQGFKDLPDVNHDFYLSVKEIYDYTCQNVMAANQENESIQHPQMISGINQLNLIAIPVNSSADNSFAALNNQDTQQSEEPVPIQEEADIALTDYDEEQIRQLHTYPYSNDVQSYGLQFQYQNAGENEEVLLYFLLKLLTM